MLEEAARHGHGQGKRSGTELCSVDEVDGVSMGNNNGILLKM
jgi:hypothetical protein